jgi:HTH-type transcriptional regulator, cell division transcriptional repressor
MADEIAENWYDEGVATFGDRLEAAREAAGLTPEELAQNLGVRDSTIEAWEADAWEPRANRMQMLAGMLNVSLMWLMTGKGDGLPAPSDIVPRPVSPALAEIVQLREQMEMIAQELRHAEKTMIADLQERQ